MRKLAARGPAARAFAHADRPARDRRRCCRALPQRYPDIQLELELSEHPVNLVEQDFDVDIRTGESNDSSFVIKRLLSSDEVLVASPAFMKVHTRIRHPHDLPQVRCLTYRREHESPPGNTSTSRASSRSWRSRAC